MDFDRLRKNHGPKGPEDDRYCEWDDLDWPCDVGVMLIEYNKLHDALNDCVVAWEHWLDFTRDGKASDREMDAAFLAARELLK